jgi:phage terminase large subunit
MIPTNDNEEIHVGIRKRVFNAVYLPYLDCDARTQIYFGGSSSGKSVFLAQRDIIKILKGGRNVLVCRQVGNTLRGSVVQEIKTAIASWNLSGMFNINKTDGTVTCIENGYQIVFAGLDDVEKLKSLRPAKGVFTDVRVEEATETNEKAIVQLYKRQRGGSKSIKKTMTLSFNPILQLHWIYKRWFTTIGWADDQKEYRDDALAILKTTYKDNRFLTPGDIYDLEHEQDLYTYNVYTLGKWGILGNIIFTNWQVKDLSKMRAQFVNHRNGLDFGFGANPAAMPVTHYDKNHQIIYIFDELYETGLTNDILADRIKKRIQQQRVVCDSAEPKSIAELRQFGVSAYGAKKGKDSVNFGIQWLQRQTIVIDTRCIYTQSEFQQYHRKEDRMGNTLDEPVDAFNHAIDALRYAYEDDMDNYEPGKMVDFANVEESVPTPEERAIDIQHQSAGRVCPQCGNSEFVHLTASGVYACAMCGIAVPEKVEKVEVIP